MQLDDHSVYPDRTTFGIDGDAPSLARHHDWTVPNPCAPTYCINRGGKAATEKLVAAKKALKGKRAIYEYPGLVPPTDAWLAWVVELHGGTDEHLVEQLKAWAKLAGGDSAIKAAKVLYSWRLTLAIGLLHTRLVDYKSALEKLEERDRLAAAGTDKQKKMYSIREINRRASALDWHASTIRAGPRMRW